MEKKNWSPYEDNILKFIKDQRNIPKWTQVARILSQEFQIKGITGKQCKQRYIQRFNLIDQNSNWTFEQQKFLFLLHNELGNKWAIISRKMNGRSDNSIKNHFYSKLRKGLKNLNKIAQNQFGRQFKQINFSVLFKIIEASEDGFKNNKFCQEDTSKICLQIKNQLIDLSYIENVLQCKNLCEIDGILLYHKINDFSRHYKRKPKKYRRIPTKPQQSFQIEMELLKKGIISNIAPKRIKSMKSIHSLSHIDKICQENQNEEDSIIKIKQKKSQINKQKKIKKQRKSKKAVEFVQKQEKVVNFEVFESLNHFPSLNFIKKKTSYYDFLEIQMDKQNIFFEDSGMNQKQFFMKDFLSMKKLSQQDLHILD